MTNTSRKDLLFTRLQELTTGQQIVDRARSDMHCIIATLPDKVTQEEIGTPPTPCGNEQAHLSSLESRNNIRNRPVVITTPPEVIEVEPVPKPILKPNAPKPSTKRMKPLEKKARTQEAMIYHAEHPHLTQEQVAIQYGLERRALSREHARKIKRVMPHDRDKTPKDMADDFLYNEKRRKKQ